MNQYEHRGKSAESSGLQYLPNKLDKMAANPSNKFKT